MEQPWQLTPADFTHRVKTGDVKVFTQASDETAALTEQIANIEREIDARVAALHGL